jgi:hypothetical protein
LLKKSKVPAVFIESTINPKLMKQLAEDNQTAIGGRLYADSLGDSTSFAPTYFEMLRYNTTTIVGALTRQNSTENRPKSGQNWWLLLIIAGILAGSFIFVAWRLDHPK